MYATAVPLSHLDPIPIRRRRRALQEPRLVIVERLPILRQSRRGAVQLSPTDRVPRASRL